MVYMDYRLNPTLWKLSQFYNFVQISKTRLGAKELTDILSLYGLILHPYEQTEKYEQINSRNRPVLLRDLGWHVVSGTVNELHDKHTLPNIHPVGILRH